MEQVLAEAAAVVPAFAEQVACWWRCHCRSMAGLGPRWVRPRCS